MITMTEAVYAGTGVCPKCAATHQTEVKLSGSRYTKMTATVPCTVCHDAEVVIVLYPTPPRCPNCHQEVVDG